MLPYFFVLKGEEIETLYEGLCWTRKWPDLAKPSFHLPGDELLNKEIKHLNMLRVNKKVEK